MARTSRTFYERNVKEESSHPNNQIDPKPPVPPPPPPKPTVIRYHGVRMVKGHVVSIQNLGDYTQVPQGISNEIVSNLVVKEPLLLAQVLSTRYLVRGLPPSDYVVALAQSQTDNDTGLRKRTRDDVEIGNPPESNHFGEPFTSIHSINITNTFFIQESDVPYLQQVLEEDAAMGEKRHFPSFVPESHEMDHVDDDLCWLTQEMQKDWSSFLQKVCFSRFDDENICPNNTRGSHPFKVYLTLGKRTQCDLGHYMSAADAALVYDKYAISRRTIGIKLLLFLFLFRRVKALKATYEESLRLLASKSETATVKEVAFKCQEMAAKAVDHISKANESYFCSDKVLYPFLNSFADTSWRLIHPFPFRLDSADTVDIHKVVPNGNDSVKQLYDGLTMILTGEPPIQSMKILLQDITCADYEITCDDVKYHSEIDGMVDQMETDLVALQNQLFRKISSFNRIFNLECQIEPLIKAEIAISANVINRYECTRRKDVYEINHSKF